MCPSGKAATSTQVPLLPLKLLVRQWIAEGSEVVTGVSQLNEVVPGSTLGDRKERRAGFAVNGCARGSFVLPRRAVDAPGSPSGAARDTARRPVVSNLTR